MILFLSDLHCRFHLVNLQSEHARQHLGRPVDAVVILGDIGLYEPFLARHFRRKRQRFHRPVYFIEGNHEDFQALPKLIQRYGDVWTYLPRGSIHAIDGWRCLALGGAAYMDAHTTPPGATIRPEDIERCLDHPRQAVDLVLTHDCPAGLGLANAPGLEHYGPTGFAGGERIQRRFEPKLWLFGHHHRWVQTTFNGTGFCGLPQAWQGYGLLASDGSFQFVPNSVPLSASTWSRIGQGLSSWIGWRGPARE